MCEASVTTDQISTFSIYTGTKVLYWVTHSTLDLDYNIFGSISDNSLWINLSFVTILSPLSWYEDMHSLIPVGSNSIGITVNGIPPLHQRQVVKNVAPEVTISRTTWYNLVQLKKQQPGTTTRIVTSTFIPAHPSDTLYAWSLVGRVQCLGMSPLQAISVFPSL